MSKNDEKFNNSPARRDQRGITDLSPEQLEHIKTVFNPRLLHRIHKHRKAVIKIGPHTPPYTRMLSDNSLNKQICLLFRRVTRNNLTNFLHYPHDYITVPDIFMVQGMVGIDAARQFELLAMGATEHDPYGKRRYTPKTFKELSDLALLDSNSEKNK